MSLHLGDIAPDFTAMTTDGEVSFHEWKQDSWVVFFSHPADFTPVCTTELGRTAALHGEFAARNTKALALSIDPIEEHHKWAPDIGEVTGTALNFPIVADPDRKVAEAARRTSHRLHVGVDRRRQAALRARRGVQALPAVRRRPEVIEPGAPPTVGTRCGVLCSSPHSDAARV